MFDDIVFLAKGGFTAYHGPVKKVEEYFASIGIVVPDRVNPPDHFIDVLEGLVKPSSGVTHQQLPVRWMLYNGYTIPPDLLHFVDEIAASGTASTSNSRGAAIGIGEDADQSFSQDYRRQESLVSSKDLSGRVTPGVARQFRYFLGR